MVRQCATDPDIVQIESRPDLDDESKRLLSSWAFTVASRSANAVLDAPADCSSLYTRMPNAGLASWQRQRGRFGAEMIERGRAPRDRRVIAFGQKDVMLAAAMDHGVDNSVFVPFFGVPARTLTASRRSARLGRARRAVRDRSAAGLRRQVDDLHARRLSSTAMRSMRVE